MESLPQSCLHNKACRLTPFSMQEHTTSIYLYQLRDTGTNYNFKEPNEGTKKEKLRVKGKYSIVHITKQIVSTYQHDSAKWL